MKNYFSCLFPKKALFLLSLVFCFCNETIWSFTSIDTPVLNTTRHSCNDCGERQVIGEITTVFNNDLCAFTMSFTMANGSADPLQITLSNDLNNFVIVPATLQIPAFGFITMQLTIYPVNGFVPNSTYQITVFGMYTTPELMPSYCSSQFDLFLGDCIANKMNSPTGEASNALSKVFETSINYYPNPVLHTLTVNWKEKEQLDTIIIYDISGRQMLQTNINYDCQEKTLSLESLTSGVYLLVIKKNTTIVGQYKIIKQ